MPTAAELIEAKQNGATFDRILHAVKNKRETVSKLPDDQLELIEDMLGNVKAAVVKLESAIRSDNLKEIATTSAAIIETCQMLGDISNE